MNITEVRVKLMNNRQDKLQAFCSVTIDNDFVVRDLKIIEGSSGPFVAMPSRKLADKCPKCSTKNHLKAGFCNECGGKLRPDRTARDRKGRSRLHVDVAHPINGTCREELQQKILEAYNTEQENSTQPGYEPRDFEDLTIEDINEEIIAKQKESTPADAENQEDEHDDAQLDASLEYTGYESPKKTDEGEDSFGSGIYT